MNDLPIRLLYLGLYNQLKKKYGMNIIIPKKELYCKLGKHGQIPKNVRWLVIKEMEDMGLIKIENKECIRLLDCKFDIENDSNKFYRISGIYSK